MVNIKLSVTFVLAAAAIAPIVAHPLPGRGGRGGHGGHQGRSMGGHQGNGGHSRGGNRGGEPQSSDVPPDDGGGAARREYVDGLSIRGIASPSVSHTSQEPTSTSVPGQAGSEGEQPPQSVLPHGAPEPTSTHVKVKGDATSTAASSRPSQPRPKRKGDKGMGKGMGKGMSKGMSKGKGRGKTSRPPINHKNNKHKVNPKAQPQVNLADQDVPNATPVEPEDERTPESAPSAPSPRAHLPHPAPAPPSSALKRREYAAIKDLFERSLEELEFEARDFGDFDELDARDFEDEYYLD